MNKVLHIVDKTSQTSGISYWKDKTCKERLEAMEFLRQQYIQYTHAPERIQRVITIIRGEVKKG